MDSRLHQSWSVLVAGTAIGYDRILKSKEYEDLQESSDSKNVSDTDVVHTKSPKNTNTASAATAQDITTSLSKVTKLKEFETIDQQIEQLSDAKEKTSAKSAWRKAYAFSRGSCQIPSPISSRYKIPYLN
jgi:hypothetical protein